MGNYRTARLPETHVRAGSSEVVIPQFLQKTREEFFHGQFPVRVPGGDDAYAKMTPEEMQQHMQKWTDWIGEGLRRAGWSTPATP